MASSDLINMGVTVVSYTLKDVRDEEVRLNITLNETIVTFGRIHLEYTCVIEINNL